MVEKRLQGHDFENGGPIKQYELNFDYSDGYFWVDNNTDLTVTFQADTWTNTIFLGGDVQIENPQDNTTYVRNMVVTENLNYQPREGDMRTIMKDGFWLTQVYNTDISITSFFTSNHVTPDNERGGVWITISSQPSMITTTNTPKRESRWKRFKRWVSNILS